MVVMVLRAFTGTAMAAGLVAPVAAGAYGTVAAHAHGEAAMHTAEGKDAAAAASAAAASGGDTRAPEPAHTPAPSHGHEQHHDHDHDHDHGQAPLAADLHAAACHGAASDAGPCAAQDHHASTCSACEICHSAMLEAPTAVTPSSMPQRGTLPRALARFDSAPLSQAIRPPIA